MVPVTHVARVVVASMFDTPVEPLGVAQVTGHPRLTFNGFVGSLENYGYTVPQVSYDEWRKMMEQYVASSAEEQKEDHAL
jgi:L-aminoadipate-semialdehyde dehydrogenase